MTESPRRPPLPKVTRSGFRTHTSPKLSKRLGASLPNLDQPLNDTMASLVLNRHRPQSVRKMTPDVGTCHRGRTMADLIRDFLMNRRIYEFQD